MFLNTESHDLHSMDEHERSVIQINEAEFLVQKIEMLICFRQKESTPIRILACFKRSRAEKHAIYSPYQGKSTRFFLKPQGEESKMEPHPFLCPWLRDPAVNRIKG